MSTSLPNENQVEGKLKQAEGKAIDVKGDLTDSPADDIKGKLKVAEGKIQEVVGNVEQKIHDSTK